MQKELTDALIRTGLEESGLVGVGSSTIEGLSFYATELARWNQKMNLTGKRSVEAIVKDLLYDAFFVFGYVKDTRSLLDMGSGAGVLAIPFSVLDRTLKVVSVDTSVKKMHFQRHIKRALGLDSLILFTSRIEDLEPQDVDAVVAKAFGSTRDVLNKAASHLSGDGLVFLLKGKLEPETDFPRFQTAAAVRYHLPGSTKEFKLITYKKVP